ncbi:MAG: AMP-binding protein [Gammaproteobacteria bacterium]
MPGYTGQQPPPYFNMARYCIGRSAAAVPDKTALVVVSDPDGVPEQWTYREIDDAVRRIGAGLRQLALKPGDRIMIRMENTSDYALVFFGAIAAGLVPLPSSPQLSADEARFLLEDSGAAALVVSEDLLLDHLPKGIKTLDSEAVTRLKEQSSPMEYSATPADAPAFLIYTSGTSGNPKGVLHGQRSAWGRRPMYQGWYGIHADDVVLHAGAFNWTYTLGVGLTDPWANKATAVLYNGPRDVSVWPTLIERHRASLFATVPSLYRQILKYCRLDDYDLSSLRHGLTAGEALSQSLSERWSGLTGKPLYEALGMSECSTYISCAPSVPVKPGSPGRPQPGRCVAILPIEAGESVVAPGETGLLAVHHSDPGLMLGYWNRPEEEALVYRNEWFVGGDLASLDEDGYIRFHGRNDDLMNAFGYRVSPEEVEKVLLQHPAVAEVGVTELPLQEDIKIIAAFVVPKNVDELDAAPILSFAHRYLADYKRPRELIFVEALPRTANGKVIRRHLARLWRSPA